MGRKARLRRERKLSPSATKSEQTTPPQDNSVLARASSLVKQPQTPPDEPPSWVEKFWDWINPLPKVDKYQVCLDSVDFEQENQVLIAAIGWSGFEKYGKGLVLVQPRKDSPTIFQYISRFRLKKTMKKYGVDTEDIQVMEELIKSYQPTEKVVMVYVNQLGEISTSTFAPKESNPPECYQMLKGEKND